MCVNGQHNPHGIYSSAQEKQMQVQTAVSSRGSAQNKIGQVESKMVRLVG